MNGKDKPAIAVIGLGYVGMPLALELSQKYKVIGFDINRQRISELTNGHDNTFETTSEDLIRALTVSSENSGLKLSCEPAELTGSTIYIITVPTPVDKNNHPDLTPLFKASATVGSVLKNGDIVIYESTVYPGCTEEACVPVLEEASGLVYNKEFFCGYSPERINPGDKERTLTKIRKVTSGSTPEAAEVINDLYASIIPAGTYLASSIKVAEAAKVIENAQRDINIAFVNELAKIFGLLQIDTQEVLAAAATKWNFLPFKPGLVGGHCIGVDPYYLAQKATSAGYYPEIILSGRRINDSMGAYIADQVIKLMLKKEIPVLQADILILGITFKENCPDVRNTRVVDIIKELETYKTKMTIFDPWANANEVKREYGLDCISELPSGKTFHAIVLAVSHENFAGLDFTSLLKSPGIIYDVKGILDRSLTDGRL